MAQDTVAPPQKGIIFMKRNCSVCGAELDIKVAKDRSYWGHYFGEVEVPVEGAKEVELYETEIEGLGKVTVVEHDKYDKFEYWECDRCFHEEEKLMGK